MSGYRIVVVQDKHDLAQRAVPILNKLSDNIAVAYSTEEAIEMLDRCPADVVLSDVRMQAPDGVSFLDLSRERWPATRVILFTPNGTIDTAVNSVKRGAFDYLTLPFDNDELLVVTGRALKEIKDEEEIARLRAEVHQRYGFHGIYTRDRRMLRIIDAVRRLAATDTTVLVCGESGTGKKLVARAIHTEGQRTGPVVTFEAGLVSETQAEGVLFGCVGNGCAGSDSKGLFLEADRGTLLIDDISSMPVSLQGKVIKALKDHEVFPTGARSPIRIDVRLIATSNLDPRRLVRNEKLHWDLYHRLALTRIDIPPLRERVEDVPLLADVFLERLVRHEGQSPKSLSADALRLLISHHWPGNVRELQDVIERAALICGGDEIGAKDILFEQDLVEGHASETVSLDYEEAKREALDRFQRRYIEDLMGLCDGNVSAAARRAGITRAALHRILKRLGEPNEEVHER